LIGAFFLITIVSQIVMAFYAPLKTETALYYDSVEDVRFKGVYIRGERRIGGGSQNGIVAYTNKDGSKLAIDSVIAEIYSSKEDIFAQQRIAELEAQIKSLSDAKAFEGTDNSQLDSFLGQLADKHLQILNAIDAGDFDKAAKLEGDYLGIQSKISVVKGVSSGYEAKITELESEINKLRASIKPPSDMRIPEPGYFVSTADGYEDILTYDGALSLTKAEIEDIIKKPSLEIPADTIGKIIGDYKWRMAAVLDTAKTHGIYEGGKVNLLIGAYPGEVKVTVNSAKDLKDGTTLYIFDCDLLVDEFVRKRVTSVRILLDDHSGIRVSQSAIRFNEAGERGVFILNGSVVEFRKINLVHTEADYVIAEIIGQPGYLKLYDKVIVSGKDLYDGKIVS